MTPAGAAVGDDVAEALGITHYIPKVNTGHAGSGKGVVQGRMEKNPPEPGQHYDLDSWWRYGSLIPDGTPVEITEKIHGSNSRFTFQNGKMYAGSRNHYRRRTDETDPWYRMLLRWVTGGRYGQKRVERCVYWLAVKQNPWIEDLCQSHPDYIFSSFPTMTPNPARTSSPSTPSCRRSCPCGETVESQG